VIVSLWTILKVATSPGQWWFDHIVCQSMFINWVYHHMRLLFLPQMLHIVSQWAACIDDANDTLIYTILYAQFFSFHVHFDPSEVYRLNIVTTTWLCCKYKYSDMWPYCGKFQPRI
jgi:hypothetical protein